MAVEERTDAVCGVSFNWGGPRTGARTGLGGSPLTIRVRGLDFGAAIATPLFFAALLADADGVMSWTRCGVLIFGCVGREGASLGVGVAFSTFSDVEDEGGAAVAATLPLFGF